MEFTRYEREVEQNCLRLRSFIRDYIRARQSGKRTGKSKEVDLLTLFFSSPEVFTEDFIIDELIDFFVAATSTTQNATQTILGHFATSPDSVERARKEFEIVCKDEDNGDKGDKAEESESKLAKLRRCCTIENS